jgi:urea-proton symporter
MGVILGSAVAPIALCITWSKANKWGCIGGAVAGFAAGIIAWLVTTSTLNDGIINVTVSNTSSTVNDLNLQLFLGIPD